MVRVPENPPQGCPVSLLAASRYNLWVSRSVVQIHSPRRVEERNTRKTKKLGAEVYARLGAPISKPKSPSPQASHPGEICHDSSSEPEHAHHPTERMAIR